MRVNKIVGMIVLCLVFVSGKVNAEVDYGESDGKNGYYITTPEINITHSGNQVMRYRLEDANGKVLTGRLDSTMRTVTIQKGILKDGENVLDTWLEDEEGEVIDSSMERIKYLVDQTPPIYPLSFTRGEILEISAEDEVSGVEGIYYALEGEEEQYLKGEKVFFALPKEFEGKVYAYAVDNAGNQGKICYFDIKNEKKEEVIIPEKSENQELKDEEKPSISLAGIPEIGITNEAAHISCSIMDNHKVAEIRGRIVQKLIDDTEIISDIAEWKKNDSGYSFQRELSEDGIYQIEIEGKDASGNTVVMKRQLIVDREAPTISKVSGLEGRTMKEFVWNYQIDEIVSDLTSWTSEIRLDGVLYKSGQVCKTPGKHIFEVSVRDLAGNEAKKTAIFYIDKPVMEEKEESVKLIEETEEVFLSKKEETIYVNELQKEENEEEKSVVILVIAGASLIGLLSLLGITIKKCTPKKST